MFYNEIDLKEFGITDEEQINKLNGKILNRDKSLREIFKKQFQKSGYKLNKSPSELYKLEENLIKKIQSFILKDMITADVKQLNEVFSIERIGGTFSHFLT